VTEDRHNKSLAGLVVEVLSPELPRKQQVCHPLVGGVRPVAPFSLSSVYCQCPVCRKIREPIRCSFRGTVPVLWALKLSVPVSLKIQFRTPNVPGFSKF
jgi:hypothetical protein